MSEAFKPPFVLIAVDRGALCMRLPPQAVKATNPRLICRMLQEYKGAPMSRLIAFSMIAIAAAAVTVGPRLGHSSADTPTWRSTIPVSWDDDAESPRDVVTKVLENTADTVRFAQSTSDGI